jgi:hypothetical protein
MAELGPLFVLPLARIERIRKAPRVDNALISMKVVRDVGGTQMLLTIADARVRRSATAGIRKGAFERTGKWRIDRGGFPDEKNPAIMLPAVVCIWMRNGGTDLVGGRKVGDG